MNMSDIPRIIGLLEEWAHWMHSEGVYLGYPRKSTCISSGYVSSTFEDMCEASDAWTLKIIDASIDDLCPIHRAAIHNRFLRSVFRFPRASYPQALTEAMGILTEVLPKKGVMI